MKNFAVFIFFCAAVFQVSAQSYWQVNAHRATVTMEYPGLPGKDVTLFFDWDPASKCAASVSVLIRSGEKLGTFKSSKPTTGPMIFSTNNKTWKEPAMIAEYTGGIEVLAYAPPDLVVAFRQSTTMNVQIMKSTPIFSFPISGASKAIDEARAGCRF